jgi:hypothetical protein
MVAVRVGKSLEKYHVVYLFVNRELSQSGTIPIWNCPNLGGKGENAGCTKITSTASYMPEFQNSM